MKKKNGFTLIELLAVIIILGILMIIAIPSVTKYISDSRKNAYIDTAKEIIAGARNLVNEGKLEMYDTNTTYYIPSNCIKTENASKSPYGEFIKNKTYAIVTYDGKGYSYYWVSLDDAGQGVPELKSIDELDTDDIKSDLTRDDIRDDIGVGGRDKVTIFNETCTAKIDKDAYKDVICKRATTLHSKTCRKRRYGCEIGGAYTYGDLIEYGNLGTKGTLHSGDAFDCDVNNDGVFDSENERFYYITTNGNNLASLIYYGYFTPISNPYSKLSDINEIDANATTIDNIHGPVTAIKYLPTSSEWSNSKLSHNQTRNITNENGTKNTLAGNIVNSFTYADKAARFLTYQEVKAACGNNITNSGDLNNCNYLLEDTQYEGGTTALIWLETPLMNSTDKIWVITGYENKVFETSVDTGYSGFKPVIDIKLSDIEY